MITIRTPRLVRSRGVALTAISIALVIAGCTSEPTPPAAPPMLLSGPDTNAVATIPDGWHQVINSANPPIPEMVAPVDCMGSNEVGCATGLARVATTTAPSVQDAARAVSDAVTGEPGVTKGPTLSEGPAKVGSRDGYRHRFQFRNARSGLTGEVAAVPSGPVVPDAQGNPEYSIVLDWITDLPGAPPVGTIDRIVDSTLVRGGEQPR